jgi:hypothetical protein
LGVVGRAGAQRLATRWPGRAAWRVWASRKSWCILVPQTLHEAQTLHLPGRARGTETGRGTQGHSGWCAVLAMFRL